MPQPTPRKRGRRALADRARILRRDKGLCQVCLKLGKLTLAVEVDHIVPLFKGGDDSDENKAAICQEHHFEKTISERGNKFNAGCDENGLPKSATHHWTKK